MTLKEQTYPKHAEAIMRLGLPLIGGHLAQFSIGLTDSVMLGWYGVPELAAITLAGSYFFTLFLLGSGFAWAVLPMVAEFATKEDSLQIRRSTRMGLWLSALFFLLVFPLFWFSGDILQLLRQSEELSGMGQAYLRVAYFGLLPALAVATLRSYLSGLEITKVVFWTQIAALFVNALTNYALIFGNWGAPELGLQGAAIASVLSTSAALVIIAVYAVKTLPQHEIFKRLWRPDWEMMGQVFRLGWPIGLTTLAEVVMFSASAIMIGWIGTVQLAAHGAALQIASATFMVQWGLSNAATVRAGNAFARKDRPHLRKGAQVTLALGFVGVALATLAFLTVPHALISVFVNPNEPEREAIFAIGAQLLAVAALFQMVDGAQVIHLGLLRGLQDTRVPMIMAGVSYWLIGMPAAYILGFPAGLGAIGVWLGLVMGLLSASLLLGARFWSIKSL